MEINIENRDKIIAMLNQGICPLCGKAYLVVLRHISRNHKIPAKELKDILLLNRRVGFLPPEQSEKYRQIAIINDLKSNLIPGLKKNPESLTKEKMKARAILHLRECPEHLQTLHNSIKNAVVRISDNEIKTYESIKDAAKDNNVHITTISRYVRHNRLDLQGNKWVYLKDLKGVGNNENS